MARPLGLVLVVAPLVELYVAVKVGERIGVLPTLALLVVVPVLGATLVRRVGTRAWRAFREQAARGGVPAREVADGAVVLLAGALLVLPGFVSDVVGLLLLLPPVRIALRPLLARYAAGHLSAAPVPPPRTGSGRIVEGEVVDELDPDD